MNALINSKVLTMSSREIAELTGKDHRHVLRDIDGLLLALEIKGGEYVQSWAHPQNGQCYRGYALPKDLTITLISGYQPKVRHAIVTRWIELETNEQPVALTQDQQLLQLAQGVIKLTAERDEAIKTKAMIGSKREATAMATASAATKRVKKLEAQLQSEGTHLSVIGAGLKDRVATKSNPIKQTWRVLTDISDLMGEGITNIPCQRYGTVKAYHVDVIAKFKEKYPVTFSIKKAGK